MSEPSATGPLTHGFLFADLRGYTAFADSRGDAAAADLLDRYRLLVRAVVADLGGAEIKTEGDSFYVVFPSASRAVAAGLAIVARAAEASNDDHSAPIRVGVGIHAGEAEERAEGYVGTAVNIAARVCAQARPGEVLVTETVRSLTRTSGRYRFTARGRPTLKGLAEPVAIYAAQRAEAGGTEHQGGGPTLRTVGPAAGAAAALLIVIGLVGVVAIARLAGGSGSGSPSGSSGDSGRPTGSSGAVVVSGSPVASPATASGPTEPRRFQGGRLQPGTYQTATFDPPFRLTLPDDSWSVGAELVNHFEMSPFGDEASFVGVFRPQVVYAPCSASETTTIGPRAQDVIDWLRSNKALTTSAPVPVRLGDLATVQLDVGLGSGCGDAQEQFVFLLWSSTTKPGEFPQILAWAVGTGARSRLYVSEIGDRAVVVSVDAPPSRFDAFAEKARSVLATFELAH